MAQEVGRMVEPRVQRVCLNSKLPDRPKMAIDSLFGRSPEPQRLPIHVQAEHRQRRSGAAHSRLSHVDLESRQSSIICNLSQQRRNFLSTRNSVARKEEVVRVSGVSEPAQIGRCLQPHIQRASDEIRDGTTGWRALRQVPETMRVVPALIPVPIYGYIRFAVLLWDKVIAFLRFARQ